MNSVHGLSDHSLVRRIAAAPCLHADAEARSRVADWLAEIADLPAGQALARLCATSAPLESLLAGLAAGSPPLWGPVRPSPQRLLSSLEHGPERRLAALLARGNRAIIAPHSDTEEMSVLRRL